MDALSDWLPEADVDNGLLKKTKWEMETTLKNMRQYFYLKWLKKCKATLIQYGWMRKSAHAAQLNVANEWHEVGLPKDKWHKTRSYW